MEKLLHDLRNIFEVDNDSDEPFTSGSASITTNKVSPREKVVRKVLKGYKSNSTDWRQYAQFDPLQYTRNLVDLVDGKYHLLILCWGPGQFSQIHDHTDSHCFVKVLQGKLREIRYAWPKCEDKPLEEIGSDLYHLNEVTYISDQIGLHRMENESHTDRTVTLHLYSPPLEQCQLFDLRTGRRDRSHSSYYTKYGQIICPKSDSALSASKYTHV